MELYLFLQGADGKKVAKECQGYGEWVRQMGPPGRFGVIKIALEPASDLGCCLSWEVSEQQIPIRFLDGVISGIKHVMAQPEFDGDHLYGTRIRVVDGAFHSTDSKLSCFYVATSIAVKAALQQADLYHPAETNTDKG